MYTMCAMSYKRASVRLETRGTQPIGPPRLPVQSPYGQPSARTELSCIEQCIDKCVQSKGAMQPSLSQNTRTCLYTSGDAPARSSSDPAELRGHAECRITAIGCRPPG